MACVQGKLRIMDRFAVVEAVLWRQNSPMAKEHRTEEKCAFCWVKSKMRIDRQSRRDYGPCIVNLLQ